MAAPSRDKLECQTSLRIHRTGAMSVVILCGVAVYLCYQSVTLVAAVTRQQCMRTAIHALLSQLLDASGHSRAREA